MGAGLNHLTACDLSSGLLNHHGEQLLNLHIELVLHAVLKEGGHNFLLELGQTRDGSAGGYIQQSGEDRLPQLLLPVPVFGI